MLHWIIFWIGFNLLPCSIWNIITYNGFSFHLKALLINRSFLINKQLYSSIMSSFALTCMHCIFLSLLGPQLFDHTLIFPVYATLIPKWWSIFHFLFLSSCDFLFFFRYFFLLCFFWAWLGETHDENENNINKYKYYVNLESH